MQKHFFNTKTKNGIKEKKLGEYFFLNTKRLGKKKNKKMERKSTEKKKNLKKSEEKCKKM